MTLALKYRPRLINDMTGQGQVSLVLGTMLERWRNDEIELPAALEFVGPRGSGKTSSARIVAAYLNCIGTEERPCQRCASCLAIYNGTSTSVVEIDAASHGGVDDIRDLGRQARLAHTGKYRVFIIDEVHSTKRRIQRTPEAARRASEERNLHPSHHRRTRNTKHHIKQVFGIQLSVTSSTRYRRQTAMGLYK